MYQAEQKTASAIVVFDIDGVIRDVGGSYRRALADTVEHYTGGVYRPSMKDIDTLKGEGVWNNDWEASRELIYRYFEGQGGDRTQLNYDYQEIVAFFQSRYRGPDPVHWTGYICDEPLLLQPSYLEGLTQAQIRWGFFSGATRGSATYVLEKRLGLRSPVLVAMEDAPGKPDPTGLFDVIQQLEPHSGTLSPVIYVGDTVADMQTVEHARQQEPSRQWIGVGILPPHAQTTPEYATAYSLQLQQAGGAIVLKSVEELIPTVIQTLLMKN
ncbi:TIGR01548 family HAD-type hydrolase [Oscillatoria sp. FACHB-1407]|uniref:TIGR01548 family HAD-type hydrolase n=1 Tax=Oscillatoria sp. FACHB-1407 TaxID=2692847 RepID=UPI00168A1E1A|nr:TIGR01548 family HAD-type hydrolase [Oscillatoria sp. FACHB-1407]MBD2462796.1 TIGR01548 family HAD-type hydrolase [Oscillatoria sp. FACHB-1407]